MTDTRETIDLREAEPGDWFEDRSGNVMIYVGSYMEGGHVLRERGSASTTLFMSSGDCFHSTKHDLIRKLPPVSPIQREEDPAARPAVLEELSPDSVKIQIGGDAISCQGNLTPDWTAQPQETPAAPIPPSEGETDTGSREAGDNDELDEFGLHEILDRLHLCQENIDMWVVDHANFYHLPRGVRSHVHSAIRKLADAYQAVGAIRFQDTLAQEEG